MADSIIGWDFGTGRPVPLPVDTPQEITLVAAHPASTAATLPGSTYVRIWNLHPLLVVTLQFYKRIRLDKDPDSGPYMDSQLQGSIQAFPIVKTMHRQIPVLEMTELPADEVFLNGGAMNDGAEINSGMQGIEFLITAHLLGPSDHDEVCTIQIKQKDPLGCIEFAQKLIDAVKVDIGQTLTWP